MSRIYYTMKNGRMDEHSCLLELSKYICAMKKVIKATIIEEYEIVTAFTIEDLPDNPGKQIIFQTSVFPKIGEKKSRRSMTFNQAIIGHNIIVKAVKDIVLERSAQSFVNEEDKDEDQE